MTGRAQPGRTKAGVAACELARNGPHAALTATRKRGRHLGGFVQIREIRGLLSSPAQRKTKVVDQSTCG